MLHLTSRELNNCLKRQFFLMVLAVVYHAVKIDFSLKIQEVGFSSE